MTMKMGMFFASMFALLLFVPMFSLAVNPVIQASFAANPVLISPGSDGYLQMVLTNTGTDAATSVQVTMTSADSGITADTYQRVNIGGLGTGQTGSAFFKFSVPKTTSAGLYRISFEIDYCTVSGACTTINQFAVINVQSQPVLELRSVKPDSLGIGSNTTLTFSVANNGNKELDNVIVTWQDSGNMILPLESGNRIVLPYIYANQQLDVSVKIVTSPKILPGAYPIFVRMEYIDNSGAKQNITTTASLKITGEARLDIANVKTDPSKVMPGNDMTLMITIENSGTADAKSVKAAIDLPFQGTTTAFLGKIKTDEDAPAVFNLQANSTGSYSYRITLGYEDDFGQHEHSQSLDMTVYNGSDGRYTMIIAFAAIAVVGFVYFAYIRRKKK